MNIISVHIIIPKKKVLNPGHMEQEIEPETKNRQPKTL